MSIANNVDYDDADVHFSFVVVIIVAINAVVHFVVVVVVDDDDGFSSLTLECLPLLCGRDDGIWRQTTKRNTEI